MSKNKSGGKSDPAAAEVHPIADLFPLIEGEEFEELVQDIRRDGLRTPILLHPDGRVLDGRNRLRSRSVEHAARLLKLGDRRLVLLVESGKLAVSAAVDQAAGHRPKVRRARRSVPEPAAGEIVLALWAPPGRVEEAMTLVEQWGFEPRGKPEPTLPLIATRRNPLAPPAA